MQTKPIKIEAGVNLLNKWLAISTQRGETTLVYHAFVPLNAMLQISMVSNGDFITALLDPMKFTSFIGVLLMEQTNGSVICEVSEDEKLDWIAASIITCWKEGLEIAKSYQENFGFKPETLAKSQTNGGGKCTVN